MIAVLRENLKGEKNRRPGTEAFQQLYCVAESTIEGISTNGVGRQGKAQCLLLQPPLICIEELPHGCHYWLLTNLL